MTKEQLDELLTRKSTYASVYRSLVDMVAGDVMDVILGDPNKHASFLASLYQFAKRRGIKVKTETLDKSENEVVVRVVCV